MKKTIYLLVALMLVFALVGCTSESADSTEDQESTTQTDSEEVTQDDEATEPDDEVDETTEQPTYSIGCCYDYISDYMAYVHDGSLAYMDDNPNVTVTVADAGKDGCNTVAECRKLYCTGCRCDRFEGR